MTTTGAAIHGGTGQSIRPGRKADKSLLLGKCEQGIGVKSQA
jgi:hypothetical protein